MATPKKTIYQLPEILTPMLSGSTIYDDGNITYRTTIQSLFNLINIQNQNTKFWLTNENKTINNDEIINILGDYVLENSTLTLLTSNVNITTGTLIFNKVGQIFIGGDLVLYNSNIINNGKISIGGAIILIGNSTIIGTGIII